MWVSRVLRRGEPVGGSCSPPWLTIVPLGFTAIASSSNPQKGDFCPASSCPQLTRGKSGGGGSQKWAPVSTGPTIPWVLIPGWVGGDGGAGQGVDSGFKWEPTSRAVEGLNEIMWVKT